MACQICGRRSAPGAKLCADCSAARKRAYDSTITQPLVMAGARTLSRLRRAARGGTRPRSASRATRAAPAVPAASVSVAAAPGPGRIRSRSLLWALLAAGIAIAAVAGWYLPSHPGVAPSTEPTPPDAATTAAVPPPAASPAPVPVPQAATVFLPSAPPAIEPETPAALRPDAKPPKRAATAAIVAPPATEVPPPVQIVRLPKPAAVAPPPAPRRIDPWQDMQQAIERCPSDGFLAHVVCEQKVRLQYCEGHWGQVAQCPGGPDAADSR